MVFCKIVWATELVAQGACGNNERTALKHCVDEDRNCQNARHEVLMQPQPSKSEADAAKCLPPNEAFQDEYAWAWVVVKLK